MSPAKRWVKKHAKARARRHLRAQERLARDRRQAQYAVKALQQALDDESMEILGVMLPAVLPQPSYRGPDTSA